MSSPAPPSRLSDHSTDYYYFVVAVAVIALLLLASNMLVVGCCSRCTLVRAVKRLLRSWGLLSGTDDYDDDHISQLIPVCKYKMEQAAAADSECSVCLMPFVEGEDVRQLPECKHSFHAPCIDMWLYSHSNCPICRADVLPDGQRCLRAAATGEATSQSRRSSIETGSMTGVVVSML